MKMLKKLALASAVTLAMIGTAQAGVVLNNWRFSPNGTGFAGAQEINEYLDVNGNAFIQLTGTSASTFNFVEHAAFNLSQADSNGAIFQSNFPGGNISALFEATGSGTFNGAFSFSSGTIKIYQNPTNNQYATAAGIYGANLGNLIASFNVTPGGGGLVDGSGNPVSNGQISVFAEAMTPGGLAPGYFFRGNGADLSAEDILAFAFTNANGIGKPTAIQVSEIACQYAGYAGPGCGSGTYSNQAGNHIFVSNNGQFKLAEVPEPGSLALFGIAILGAGAFSRKRKSV